MNISWNPNVAVAQMSAQPIAQMGLNANAVAANNYGDMERRRRRGCKHGRTTSGRCRKRSRR